MSALQTVGSSTQVRQSTTDPTVSRTPTDGWTPLTREVGSDEGMLRAVSVWLGERGITPRSPKWLSMVRSEAVQRVAMASRVNIAFPSRPLSPAFSVEQCSSGRRDARREVCVSLADFFDVERNPATILSRCFAVLWEQVSLLVRVWCTVDPLESEHPALWNRRFMTTEPRLCYLGC